MPTVELDIRQLADEGGTAPLAPITVTDAVLDEDGNTLTDTISEIKSGLTSLGLSKLTGDLVSAYNRCQIGGNTSNIFYIRAYLDAGTTNYIQLLCNGQAKTMSLSLATNGVEVQIFSVTGS